MVRKKDPYPSEGDLVIATVVKVFAHGAFVKLDEYGDREGFIHISEVASIWVKNIRDYVREGQKTVSKVLSVDTSKGHIDLSVRRVGDAQRANKNQEWKRAQKADKLLERAAKEMGKTLDQAYDDVGFVLEDRYGEIYAGLEEVLIEGENALEDVPEEWRGVLVKNARESIVLPNVEIEGLILLQSKSGDGVVQIKQALTDALNTPMEKDVKLEISYVSPPNYRIHVNAPDYKTAEEAMKKTADRATEHMKKSGGIASFTRVKQGAS